MEQNNIKATLTAHGFRDCSEEYKDSYLTKGIKTSLVDTCLANTSGSAVLCDDSVSAARHVADFIVIMKYRDPGSNSNISDVNTDQGGGGGQGRGGGPGHGGRGGGGGNSCGV